MIYFLLLILSLFTYFFNTYSLFQTESFILFLAFFIILILLLSNKNIKINYSKDHFKWYETILFYTHFKTWHRNLIRDKNIKINNYLLLIIEIQKYQIKWIKRNINKIKKRDINSIIKIILKRLEIFKDYKKQISNKTIKVLNQFSISNLN